MRENRRRATLVLEDGTEFEGRLFGYPKNVNGEVVFNTGMVGYAETMTDPSYRGQILAITYPLIGNYGVPDPTRRDGLYERFESERIQTQALIVGDYSDDYSHHEATRSLEEWMHDEKIPGITGVDTRELTHVLRERGSTLGKVIVDDEPIEFEDPNLRNLAAEVCVPEKVFYDKGGPTIAIVDCGTKNNIIRAFLDRGVSVLRTPWDHDFNVEDVSGVVISNGPGDPKMCDKTIERVREAMTRDLPILGICLGSQILALASGADTYKMKYGHRGHNQPVNEWGAKRCYITSQNHGYAIDSTTLKLDWREWFANDNDETNEGLIHVHKPFFGAQFHPEASPGPDDTEFIFDMFCRAAL